MTKTERDGPWIIEAVLLLLCVITLLIMTEPRVWRTGQHPDPVGEVIQVE